jgi:hypothetical protein
MVTVPNGPEYPERAEFPVSRIYVTAFADPAIAKVIAVAATAPAKNLFMFVAPTGIWEGTIRESGTLARENFNQK